MAHVHMLVQLRWQISGPKRLVLLVEPIYMLVQYMHKRWPCTQPFSIRPRHSVAAMHSLFSAMRPVRPRLCGTHASHAPEVLGSDLAPRAPEVLCSTHATHAPDVLHSTLVPLVPHAPEAFGSIGMGASGVHGA